MPTGYKTRWGSWYGKETEFYRRCATLVTEVVVEDLDRIGGARLSVKRDAMIEAFAKLGTSPSIDRLRLRPQLGVEMQSGYVQITAYSKLDPVVVHQDVLAALAKFDGSPTAHVQARLSAETGVALDDREPERLVDGGVLVSEAEA